MKINHAEFQIWAAKNGKIRAFKSVYVLLFMSINVPIHITRVFLIHDRQPVAYKNENIPQQFNLHNIDISNMFVY